MVDRSDEVWCNALQYILTVRWAKDFSTLSRKMNQLIWSSAAWKDVEVDISDFQIGHCCWDSKLFQKLKESWKCASWIVASRIQLRYAAFGLPLYSSWSEQDWKCGDYNEITSHTEFIYTVKSPSKTDRPWTFAEAVRVIEDHIWNGWS